ncbi:MAG: hypothetical protein U0R72_13350 [Nakamurella multipartita]
MPAPTVLLVAVISRVISPEVWADPPSGRVRWRRISRSGIRLPVAVAVNPMAGRGGGRRGGAMLVSGRAPVRPVIALGSPASTIGPAEAPGARRLSGSGSGRASGGSCRWRARSR